MPLPVLLSSKTITVAASDTDTRSPTGKHVKRKRPRNPPTTYLVPPSKATRSVPHVFLPSRHRGGLCGAPSSEEDFTREQLDGRRFVVAASEAAADVVGGPAADGIYEEAGREGTGRHRRKGCAGEQKFKVQIQQLMPVAAVRLVTDGKRCHVQVYCHVQGWCNRFCLYIHTGYARLCGTIHEKY